ncbi:MAG: tryptophan--tRNA ligase, partial [Microbacteriaceae bacterium]|nr:tryptophan--tRNA ligase [Microbacteriaceae bacterium]
MTTPRLFSGMQPSADSLHFGNYAGALLQWIEMQKTHDAVFCVVDLHAITVAQDPKTLADNTRKTAAQYIACGIDPEASTLFVQSHVRAHSELAWILNTFTSFGEASRMTQFKDKSTKQGSDNATVGLFTYPILQAADILLYDADVVPVGEDQRQHIELTRNLAERVNQRLGSTLIVPQVTIMESAAKIYDLQNPGSKMSKSGDSPQGILWLLDEPTVLAKKIKSSVTDTDNEVRFDPERKPGISNLLSLLALSTQRTVEDVVGEFAGGGYGTLKTAVADAIVERLDPIRQRTEELLKDPGELDRILGAGAEK